MTEADPITCVPQVSLFKLGRLEKVASNQAENCLLTLELRDDFKYEAEEEAQMRELWSLTEGAQKYLGDGKYQMPLSSFVECFIEVQQPGLRKRLQNLLADKAELP